MFTGIIQTQGHVQHVTHRGETLTLQINAPQLITPTFKIGDSVAVNGACLTATQLTATTFTVDVMPESVRRTNLGSLKPDQAVNLERPLQANGYVDGHFVLGHVDYQGRLVKQQVDQNAMRLWFSLAQPYQAQLVEKGSVAVDGVSLTVVQVTADTFEVDLIPHTQQQTTLSHLKVDDPVNIETDILGKYMVRQRSLERTR